MATRSGDVVDAPGWLSAPVGGALVGAQLLADGVSTKNGVQAPIVLEGLHDLGSCPGTPIQGSLVVTETGTVKGNLDGTSLDVSAAANGHSYVSYAGEDHVFLLLGDHGRLILEGSPGAAKGALLMPGNVADEANSLLCVGTASVVKNGSALTTSLGDLSRASGKWPGSAVSGMLTATFCQP